MSGEQSKIKPNPEGLYLYLATAVLARVEFLASGL